MCLRLRPWRWSCLDQTGASRTCGCSGVLVVCADSADSSAADTIHCVSMAKYVVWVYTTPLQDAALSHLPPDIPSHDPNTPDTCNPHFDAALSHPTT